MPANPIGVSELTAYLQELFNSNDMLSDIWIEGEVIESTTSRAGHVFFALSDGDSRLKGVVFRGNAVRQSYLPEAGQSCTVHGSIAIYGRDGTYQLYADLVRPAGIGLAALEFELLKQRLGAEGLFDPARKRPIPEKVRTLGVVTSADGAVWHDIRTVAERRNPLVRIILSPASVQGETAAQSLISALKRLVNRSDVDVVIIGRGGGSVTDLSAFNDEALAREVFASPVTVISAVGHETDWTLLDLVADVRAPTPSVAAELCTRPISSDLRAMRADLIRMGNDMSMEFREQLLHLSATRDRIDLVGPLRLIRTQSDSRASYDNRLQVVMNEAQARRQRAVHDLVPRVATSTTTRFGAWSEAVRRSTDLLKALDPSATLARGYASVTHEDTGNVISSVQDVSIGRMMVTRFHDGSVESVVSRTSEAQR
ncbi:exodeoxyribonuclease VII large subunit [soil metagenome]